jgi:RNA polymerase-binding transcription factor DksA
MEKEKQSSYKEKLLANKAKLENELKSVGRINPDNPVDWEATPVKFDGDFSDPNDKADEIQAFENNTAILKQLETQLLEVNDALAKVEKGVYGTCEVCGEVISDDRLDANPSARTCSEHM